MRYTICVQVLTHFRGRYEQGSIPSLTMLGSQEMWNENCVTKDSILLRAPLLTNIRLHHFKCCLFWYETRCHSARMELNGGVRLRFVQIFRFWERWRRWPTILWSSCTEVRMVEVRSQDQRSKAVVAVGERFLISWSVAPKCGWKLQMLQTRWVLVWSRFVSEVSSAACQCRSPPQDWRQSTERGQHTEEVQLLAKRTLRS